MSATNRSNFCPTCGQVLVMPRPTARIIAGTADQLVALLEQHRDRQVYRADGGSWHVTYNRGEVVEEAVMELLRAGRIHSSYVEDGIGRPGMYQLVEIPPFNLNEAKARKARRRGNPILGTEERI